ncbi:MAG TPA: quinone-dependent dihydroorotate dehydrogenase [Hyphomicrobiales bacterium]|nr:quinone-dependent dihydroorotate dehydrogenase [Hyphomicrobiales bacterium]
MIGAAWPLLDAAFSRLDPERAHQLTLTLLERAPLPPPRPDDPRLAVEAFGLRFPNPVGLAAGFDKDARVPDAMLRLGFGFTEVGTVTPRPQPGNPRPRVFRLPDARGTINRLGFNSGGHAAARRRLIARRGRPGIVGVNIGANKDSADRIDDYVGGVIVFAEFADYLAVNISSPNTPGLRDLQARAALDDLLLRVIAARDTYVDGGAPRRPVLLKIAPDLALGDLDDVAEVALRRGVDGLMVGNTTLARPAGLGPAASEAGGLSGGPLFRRANWMLAEAYLRLGGRIPLVGIGGITRGEDAVTKLRAGATLVQLYTGLVFAGPALIGAMKRALLTAAPPAGLGALTGSDAEAIARAGPEA